MFWPLQKVAWLYFISSQDKLFIDTSIMRFTSKLNCIVENLFRFSVCIVIFRCRRDPRNCNYSHREPEGFFSVPLSSDYPRNRILEAELWGVLRRETDFPIS